MTSVVTRSRRPRVRVSWRVSSSAVQRLLIALVALASLVGASTQARAQAPLERAQQALGEADFAGAVRAFDEAAQADEGLSREQLLDLYVGRAQAHLALGDPDAARADVRRLLSLDPGHELDYRVRPEIREMAEELRGEISGPLEVTAEVGAETGAVTVSATASDDPASLVREVRVFGRVGGGEWLSGVGSVVVPVASATTVEYYAQAVGPGGAVLATDGTEGSPRTHAYRDAPADGGDREPPLEDGSDGPDEGVLWAIGGIALAVGIAVVVTVLVLTSASNDATQPGSPMVFPTM